MNKSFFWRFLFFAGLSSGCLPVVAAELNPLAYPQRIEITFPNAPPGETLVRFPALVTFDTTTSNFYGGMVSPTGGDLRFTDGSQTNEIPYEVERYATNGTSYIWVQVPLLNPTAKVFAYWGNAAASTAPAYTTNGAVWSEGYLAVWHLHGTDASGTFKDSTANGRDGVNTGSTNVSGFIADAQGFDGVASFIDSQQNFLSGLGQFSLSVWANGVLSDGARGLVGQNDVVEFGPNGTPSVWTPAGGGMLAGGVLPNLEWHHITALGDGTTKRIYYDGVQNVQGGGPTANYGNSAFPVRIGGGGIWAAGGNFFNGMIDEVRASSVARSSNWLWSAWMNMASNATFNSYGPTTPIDITIPYIASRAASGLAPTNATLNGELISTGSAQTVVWVFYGTNDGGEVRANWSSGMLVATNSAVPPVAFANAVGGLTPDTPYYFRHYATNAFGEQWAYSSSRFITAAPPTVNNAAGASGIGMGGATMNGAFASENRGDTTIFWGPTDGTNNVLAWANFVSLGSVTAQTFSTSVGGLLYGIPYYYRSYATNAFGDGWANSSTNFKTAAPAGITISNEWVSGVTDTSAVIHARFSSPASVFEIWAYWGPTDGGAVASNWANAVSLGIFTNRFNLPISTVATGLMVGTTNYFTYRMTNCVADLWSPAATLFRAKGTPQVVNGGAVPLSNSVVYLQGDLALGGEAEVSVFWGLTDAGPAKAGWDAQTPSILAQEGAFGVAATGMWYGLEYQYRAYASNAFGEAWSPVASTTKSRRPFNLTGSGLTVSQFDTVSGEAQLNPIRVLQAQTPDAVQAQLADLDYLNNFDVTFPGINDNNNFSLLWEGFFVPIFGAGTYSFGLDHNDDAMLALDFDDDGDFDDGATYDPQELVVDGYTVGCCGITLDSVDLLAREYRMAIGFTALTGANNIQARFGPGRTNDINSLAVINGALGAFYSDQAYLVGITNLPPTGVTAVSADLNGRLLGTGSVFGVWAYWGNQDGGTNLAAWTNSQFFGTFTNVFEANLIWSVGGLTAGGQYYYAFRMTNCAEDTWAQPSFAFETLSAPVVDNGVGAEVLAANLARLNGTLVSGGVAQAMIYWGTSDGGTTPGLWDNVLNFGQRFPGAFSAVASNLLFGVEYNYRAYASNTVGEAWAGATEVFKTVSPDDNPMSVTNGLTLWLRADTLGSNHNDNVGFWNDDSGAGNNALQGNITNAPTLITNAIYGLPAVRFDGDDRMDLGGVTARTIFAVTMADATAGGLDGLIGATCCDQGIRREGNDFWRFPGAGVNDFASPVGSIYRVNGAATNLAREFTWNVVEAYRGSGPQTFDSLGGYFNNRDYNGDMAEMLVFDRALTTAEQDAVGTYLAEKYGLDHVYSGLPRTGVANEFASFVTRTSAFLNANLYATNAVFDVDVYFGPTDGGTDPLAWSNRFVVGSFTNVETGLSYGVGGLTEGQDYYYAFAATNCAATLWAQPSKRFRTSKPITNFFFKSEVTICGYSGDEVLQDFPLLIKIGTNIPGFAYDQMASPNGGDLRILDGNEATELNYEIGRWDTNGVSLVWVQIPDLVNTGTAITIVWGNPVNTNPPAYTTNGAVWSAGYEAVWHLEQTNALGAFFDSTANGHNATNFGATSVTGVVGSALDFNGANNYLDTGQSFLNNLSEFTLTVWASGIFSDGRRGFVGQNDSVEFGVSGNPHIWTERGAGLTGSALPNDTWHHITFVGNTVVQQMHYDGVLNVEGGFASTDYGDSGFNVHIGGGGVYDPGGNWWNGMLDEVRVSTVARSSNWLNTAWINMVSNESFLCYQPAISLGASDLGIAKTVSTNNLLIGTNLTYWLTVLNSSTVTVGGVVVTDSLPASVTFLLASPPASATNGSELVFNLGFLPGGGSTTITVNVSVSTPVVTIITNVAFAAMTNAESVLGNNRSVAATVIPDSDGDGIANPADPDDDNDAFPDISEYIARTDSLDANSFLWLSIQDTSNQQVRVLGWPSVTGVTYSVEGATDLYLGPWSLIHSNLPGVPVWQSIFSTNTFQWQYYRLGAESP